MSLVRSIRKSCRTSASLALVSSTALLCALGAGACALPSEGEEGESTGSREDAVYVLSTAAWPGNSIHVCYMNPSVATSQERGWIRTAVESTWERVSDLDFTGFDTCPSSFPATEQVIKIEFRDERPHTGSLGVYINQDSPGMVLNATYQADLAGCASTDPFVSEDGREWASTKMYCMSVHAVHEFGHAIGYSHEQNRPDTPSYLTCQPQGGNGDTTLGDWDLYSVMSQSYCISSTGRLSVVDIAATQQVYGVNSPNYFWYVDGNTQETHGDYSLPASLQVDHFNMTQPAGYTMLAGDFDGDHRGDLFRYGAGTLQERAYYGNSTRNSFTTKDFAVGGTFRPFVGNFDGLNGDDIFWYRPGDEIDNVWWSNGAARTFTNQDGVHNVGGTYVPVVGDYDGDGRDDIFWFASGTGRDTIWWGNANKTFTKVEKLTNSAGIPMAGDFDGDGRDDILFYTSGTPGETMWWGNANRTFGAQILSENVTGVYAPTVGDFDGNGTDDILWNHETSLDDKVWLWRKGQRTYLDSHVIAVYGAPKGRVADFDGDGVDDIYWQGQ